MAMAPTNRAVDPALRAAIEQAPAILRRVNRIRPMAFADTPPNEITSPRPRYIEVDPKTLYVDHDYQRNLSDRSLRLIKKMIKGWDWNAFKPPNVVEVDGILHVVDGQHTAIAAASHPGVGMIPVQVGAGSAQADRAASFVKVNRDRISTTPTQVHHALVKAGDEDALTIHQVCERVGIKILKAPPGNGYYKPGETMAIKSISAVVRRRYATGARRCLEIVAKMCPVPAGAIRAVEALLFSDKYPHAVDTDGLALLLRHYAPLDEAAKARAASVGCPHWEALADVLYRRVEKSHGLADAG